MTGTLKSKHVTITVIVSALGYFVDIYDLLLFGIVRVSSLRGIGVAEDQLLNVGIDLINSQMAGMLVGGILWGILGDRKGRLSVLFGSIFLYSIANIANAFITTPTQYAVLRFLAGVGLAGELGAAVTLVSEVMDKKSRGLGTTIVASVGILGAVLAAIIGDLFSWQTAYIIGGCMGLALLVLRLKMLESGMYSKMEKVSHVRRGDFFMLFKTAPRFIKYLCCILIGLPIWYVIGILITFSPELAKNLGVLEPIRASTAIMVAYIGLAAGDLCSGLLSQYLGSRKKVVGLFLMISAAGVFYYTQLSGVTAFHFYAVCMYLGFTVGYWAVFVMIGAEQFGTNLRATVATTVPNFVRGSVVPITLSFEFLSKKVPMIQAVQMVGLAVFLISAGALWQLYETFSKDLDYHEL